MNERTAGPWVVEPNGYAISGPVRARQNYREPVAYCPPELLNRDANAAFIVQACNAHADLVVALRGLSDCAASINGAQHAGCTISAEAWAELYARTIFARAALAKAGAA